MGSESRAITKGVSNASIGVGSAGGTVAALRAHVCEHGLHDGSIQARSALYNIDIISPSTSSVNRKTKTYACAWELEPNDEDGLEGEVPGEIVEKSTESKALNEVEEAKDDPVSKPLNVVVVSGRLDSFDGKISRERPTEEVGNRRSEGVD